MGTARMSRVGDIPFTADVAVCTLTTVIGAGEQPRLATERNLAVTLPISGRML
jgi:hypothetical protein